MVRYGTTHERKRESMRTKPQHTNWISLMTMAERRWNKKRNNFSIKNQIFQEFRRCRWCCCCVRVFQQIRWSDRTLFKCKSKMDRRDFVLDSKEGQGRLDLCVATRRMAFWWHLIDCWFINGHERQIAFNAVISWRFFFPFSSYFPLIFFLYSLLRFVSNF